MSEPALTLTLPPDLLEQIAQRAAQLVLEHHLHPANAAGSPFMTIPEAAGYARCKRQRIDDLLSARRLQRYKDGRRTLILRQELDTYLNHPADPPRTAASDWLEGKHRATVPTRPADPPAESQ